MTITVRITIDRLGVPPRQAAAVVEEGIPEYLTANGRTVQVEEVVVIGKDEEDEL